MKIMMEFNPSEIRTSILTGTLPALLDAIAPEELTKETKAPVVEAPVQMPMSAPIQQAPVQQQPVYQQPQMQQPPMQQPLPTVQQTYSMEQLAVAAQQLMDAGHIAQLQQLLASFGVPSMMQLPKERYGEFATQLRAMGAKI